ncbi:pyruvate, water dikinase regulatory protein [Miniphocaeibacter massiliensis]|uniref:pyruvate, water dikinase regulatory protein n=1 Tax=Miniphocaeibacter massiliensis TaxID=2041841 RepID=UPI000C06A00F|nr:pyruvate, water dikinase regulatory protein [Miniphocaeibacter massiliensis]
MKNKSIVIVSDSTGETAIQVINAIKIHFDVTDTKILRYPDIFTTKEIDEIMRDLSGNNLIFSTIVSEELLNYLKLSAENKGFMIIDLFEEPLKAAEEFFGQKAKREIGLSRKLSEDYFEKIDSLDFAMKYDDGKDPRGIKLADIVLIGISRTSKTPLSLNLAFKNYKVCNIPLVPEIEPPKELFEVDSKKIIGLIINKENLNEIRNERLKSMGILDGGNYSSDSRIVQELRFAMDLYNRLNCKVIDVTRKTIEETTLDIISYINSNKII